LNPKNLNLFLFLSCLLNGAETLSITTGIMSVVYNLKISEITELIAEKSKKPFGLDVTIFEEARWENRNVKTNFSDRSNAVGGMWSFIYIAEPLWGKSWYFQMYFAVARVSEVSNRVPFSRIQTDDFLMYGGYSWPVNSMLRFTFSGLLGIPTHKDTSLIHTQFGLGHVGLGFQLDSVINYLRSSDYSIRIALRLIGTIPRRALFNCCLYNYNLGEIIDFFISHNSSFGNHSFEFGYNPSFVCGGGISPNVQSIASEINLIRNSYFIAYEYTFKLRKIENAVECGISFASDVIPKKTGQKLIVLGWLTWGIDF